ncbi:hypothetical protein AAVH_17965 [Aphelenchoides avenae]|nr:hypothetical protein AAVH_17965 [Aphelenchus avenae]
MGETLLFRVVLAICLLPISCCLKCYQSDVNNGLDAPVQCVLGTMYCLKSRGTYGVVIPPYNLDIYTRACDDGRTVYNVSIGAGMPVCHGSGHFVDPLNRYDITCCLTDYCNAARFTSVPYGVHCCDASERHVVSLALLLICYSVVSDDVV